MGVPALEPFRRVVAGGEKGDLQMFQALRVRQGCIRRCRQGNAQRRVEPACGRCRDHHAAHQLRMIHIGDSRNVMSKRMPGNNRRASVLLPDHRGNVVRQCVKIEVLQRAAALAHAARLGPQHAKAGCRNALGDGIVILRVTGRRGQEHDQRATPFGNHFNLYWAVGHHFATAPRVCQARGAVQTQQHRQ